MDKKEARAAWKRIQNFTVSGSPARNYEEGLLAKSVEDQVGSSSPEAMKLWLKNDDLPSQCKMDGCKRRALAGGKRHCAAHRLSYLEKQRHYESAPLCREPGCKVRTRHESGMCPDCRQKYLDREERDRVLLLERERAQAVRKKLDDCSSLEELKEFLLEHVKLIS